MLTVSHVFKNYGKKQVIKDVSFTLNKGQITVLAGQNGAGKSTIIKCITGFLKFDGDITLEGKRYDDLEVKRQIGYIPEVPELYNELTVKQHFQFIALAYGVTDYEERVQKYLSIFNLTAKQDELCGALSKGMRQKVSIICALVLNPKVLIVDEPMVGLDPDAIREFKRILVQLKEECAIFISTHLLESVENLWDKVLIMNSGEVVFESEKDAFVASGQSLEDVYFAHHTKEQLVDEAVDTTINE